MKLVGETELRALFYELKVADEGLAPDFAKTWFDALRARNMNAGRTGRFSIWPFASRRADGARRRNTAGTAGLPVTKLSLAFAALLLIMTVSVLGLWWKDRQREIQPIEFASTGVIPEPVKSPESKERTLIEPPDYVAARSRRNSSRKLTAITKSRSREMQMAVALSSWQSPTALLMESPADEVLTALPQLEQSATELKVFLPHSVNKENQ